MDGLYDPIWIARVKAESEKSRLLKNEIIRLKRQIRKLLSEKEKVK